MDALRTEGLFKSFGSPPTAVLKNIELSIKEGEFISITGRSGSGKSTLLYVISTLDPASAGKVLLSDIPGSLHDINKMSSRDVHAFRNSHMGFVFQFHYLLPELTALENVLMPAIKMKRRAERMDYARALLKEVGIGDKADRFPSQLSGGEQQRVAIARALVMEPRFIFADEPTGNLDSVNGQTVMEIFKRINREKKTTIIYVTHDRDFAAMADRQIELVDGVVSDDSGYTAR